MHGLDGHFRQKLMTVGGTGYNFDNEPTDDEPSDLDEELNEPTSRQTQSLELASVGAFHPHPQNDAGREDRLKRFLSHFAATDKGVQTQSLSIVDLEGGGRRGLGEEISNELAPAPQARLQTLKAAGSNEAGCVDLTHKTLEQWKVYVCAVKASKMPHCSIACKADLTALSHYHCSRGDHEKGDKTAKAFHGWDTCVESLQQLQLQANADSNSQRQQQLKGQKSSTKS